VEFHNRKPLDRQTLVTLVTAAKQGDRQAMDELIQHFQGSVYATVYRRVQNEAEAQELCQDVFMRALAKIGQLANPAAFGGWLRSIAHRMAINRAVRCRPSVSLEAEGIEGPCADGDTPLGEILEQERRDQLKLGLDRLAPMDRDTLVAFYFRGQSLVEMSNHFHTPVGTIKRRLHVARKRLAKELAAMAPA